MADESGRANIGDAFSVQGSTPLRGIGQRQVDEAVVSLPPADHSRGQTVVDSTLHAMLSVWGRAVVLVSVTSTVNV
jgi:hypothetical protein